MSEPVIIKKYANRRLYNTESSMYITLEELALMVREGRDFEVVDAKTGTDITRSVLAQILFEEETKGAAMLPVSFLRQLISFYDNSVQSVLPHYLEMVMDVFTQQQQRMKEQTDKVLGPFAAFNPMQNVQNMQELQRQNMEQFQKMASMFNPYVQNPADKDTQINELSNQVAELTAQIEKLKKS